MVDTRVVANVDGRMYVWTAGRKTVSLYCAMPEAGATKMTQEPDYIASKSKQHFDTNCPLGRVQMI